MDLRLTGGCACGHIRYELLAEPMFVHCCHCLNCQRQTGSAFSSHAMIETDRIRLLSGEPEPTSVPTGSGDTHDIYSCPGCRVAVWSDYGNKSWERLIKIGTLDDSSALRPQAHIFTLSKVPWLVIPSDVPSFDEFYDLPTLWPAASLDRKVAAEKAHVQSQL
jgi:hypothetical protein